MEREEGKRDGGMEGGGGKREGGKREGGREEGGREGRGREGGKREGGKRREGRVLIALNYRHIKMSLELTLKHSNRPLPVMGFPLICLITRFSGFSIRGQNSIRQDLNCESMSAKE